MKTKLYDDILYTVRRIWRKKSNKNIRQIQSSVRPIDKKRSLELQGKRDFFP